MKPNIVWLTLESTRFDHTSLSQYHRDTTPNLKRIAAGSNAKSFDDCHSHGIWTRTSTASILTGTYPSYHNVLDSDHFLPDEIPTFPGILSENGYDTIGFAINSHVDTLCQDKDIFEDYVSNGLRRSLHKIAGYKQLGKYLIRLRKHNNINKLSADNPNTNYLITKGIKKRISEHQQPSFVYAHYQDQHIPFLPPAEQLRKLSNDFDQSVTELMDQYLTIHQSGPYNKYRPDLTESEWEVIRAVYDATLSYTDEWIGYLVDYIESNLDNTIVVISGDHGELLGEHDLLTHYYRAYEEVSNVPLIVRGPTAVADYDGPIQHIDIVRTLLEELGLAHDKLQGKDLRTEKREFSVIQRGENRVRRACRRIQDDFPDFEYKHKGLLTTIKADKFKYEMSPSMERLYLLPNETTDIKSEYPTVLEEFRSRYETFTAELETYPPIAGSTKELTQQTKKRLENMGYLVD